MATALIISHPGHELRVFHWLETTKPLVLVLTDGSGSIRHPRLESTTALLKNVGAQPGRIYGAFADADIYTAILQRKENVFIDLLENISSFLVEEDIDVVVGDAMEGYNPSHDLCRYLIGAAVELASPKTKRSMRNYDFTLAGRPDLCPPELSANSLWLILDESALERKLAAASAYPELAVEVEATLRLLGRDIFRKECLRRVANNAGTQDLTEIPPFYEQHGENRVREGIYGDVIRYREHLRPLAETLWRRALQG